MKDKGITALFRKMQDKLRTESASTARKGTASVILTVISLIVLLTAVTFAWFITAKTVISSDIEGNLYRPEFMQIGVVKDDVVEWSSSLELPILQPLNPVCGDGQTFYSYSQDVRAALSSYGSEVTTEELKAFLSENYGELLEEKEGYSTYKVSTHQFNKLVGASLLSYAITADFVVQGTKDGNVYINTDSVVSPAFEISPMAATEPSVSTGYIAGAIRIGLAVKDSNGEYKLKCIWVPNSRYEYSADTNSFNPNGEIEETYSFVHQASSTDFVSTTVINTADYPDGYAEIDGITYIWDLEACEVSLSPYTVDTQVELRIVIWLEGTDRECVNELSGGRVDVSLALEIR